ncbi:MAG: helix-turn-helix transcriptional regulator [Myxococcota bacterium]
MIRTDTEYEESRKRLLEEKKRLAEHEARMKDLELSADEMKRALDPLRSFHLQLQEEVEAYERVQRGSFDRIANLHGLGRLLIAARVYRDISQRELASRLDVHESQVSRDERNEYRSITVERAARILDVLQVELESELRVGPQT